jgi:hypothetical protein
MSRNKKRTRKRRAGKNTKRSRESRDAWRDVNWCFKKRIKKQKINLLVP